MNPLSKLLKTKKLKKRKRKNILPKTPHAKRVPQTKPRNAMLMPNLHVWPPRLGMLINLPSNAAKKNFATKLQMTRPLLTAQMLLD